MSFADDYESEMVQRLAHRHQEKERIIRAAREAELMQDPETDTFEQRWHARAEQLDRIADSIGSCASSLQKLLYDFRAANTRRGEVYGNRFTLKAVQSVVQIDLKKPEESFNLPTALRLDLPREPLSNLTIINEGAGVLNFSMPKYASDTQTKTVLQPPAAGTNPVPLVLDFKQPVVERLNLLATTTDLVVNLITVA
jgi:hypothetical protein